MKRLTAFDGLSNRAEFSDRYERIRKKTAFLEKKWQNLAFVCPDLQTADILVIGPGTGKSDVDPIKKSLPHAIISTVDFGAEEFACVDSWLRYCLREDMAFNKKPQLDIVVAQQILQHTTDWRSFFYVLSNVLKDGGIFVFDSFDAPIFKAIQGQTFSVSTDSIVDEWEKFFLTEYRKREFNDGIFWDPEFVSNVPWRLGSLLALFGFEKIDIGEDETSELSIDANDLRDSFINREYGPLFWGSYSEGEERLPNKAIPVTAWKGLAKYQLHAYRKKTVPHNFPDLLNNIRMINNKAVLRLDTHLRYDAAVRASEVIESECFNERMLLSYIQSLLFAGAIDCGTDLFFPFLGNVKKVQPLYVEYPSRQRALISRQNYSKVITIFSHHLSLIAGGMQRQSFTEFLGQKIGRPVTLIFQLYDIESPGVKISDCDFGFLFEFSLPTKWSIEVPQDNIGEAGAGRIFSHYLYADLREYFEEIRTTEVVEDKQKETLIENVLIAAIRDFHILDFSEGTLNEIVEDFAKYVYASRALWSNYKVIFYIIHQLYADRDEPATRRDSVGIGSVIILEDSSQTPLTDLDKERLGLLHVVTREFASSMLFHSLGEIEARSAVYKAESELFQDLVNPTRSLLKYLSKASNKARVIKSLIELPSRVLLDVSVEDYFNRTGTTKTFAGVTIHPQHEWQDTMNCNQLMGAVVLIAMGVDEERITKTSETDLWIFANKLLWDGDDRGMELKYAMRMLLTASTKEESFYRLKACFHGLHKTGDFFSLAILILLFPKSASESEVILKHINDKYSLKYSGKTPHNKMQVICDLVYEDKKVPEQIDIQFVPPTGGAARISGYLQIKATGRFEPANDMAKIFQSFKNQEPADSARSDMADMLFNFFGEGNKTNLTHSGESIFIKNDSEEKLVLQKDMRIIKFLINKG